MSKITPFRAWHYNPQRISDFSKVVAPPYDVINPKQRELLAQHSPYNIVRVDLPQEQGKLNRYEAAREIFENWKQESILIQDEKPSLYLYFQTYSLADGRRLTRRGFFARRRIESFQEGGVKPHERTFAGPKQDRLSLMQSTQAQLSPIFVLYADPKHEVGPQLEALSKTPPELDFIDENDIQHRLWRIVDTEALKKLLQSVHDHPLLIADGHHRYETAVNYCQERRAALGHAVTGEESFNDVMMYFCSLDDPGLVILPTHRVLAERPEGDIQIFRKLLEEVARSKIFSLQQLDNALAFMKEEGEHEHVLAWVHDDQIEVLVFDVEKLLQSEVLSHMHFALRDLDVTILHDLVLEEMMGISKGAQKEYGKIQYIQDPQEVLRLVKEKQTYAFLMNATKIKQVEAITDIGETMPQKSTFFYPKLLTGLVFYDLKS
jgi:uncharacterized protein (DUF1015 family)